MTRPFKHGFKSYPAGTFLVRATPESRLAVNTLASERGVSFFHIGADSIQGATSPVRMPRIALWDVYGGEISSGWMRFVLEQFEFPYEVLFANDLDNADLSAKYDVLILPDGATFSSAMDTTMSFQQRIQPARVPAEWRSRLGRITVEKTLPRIRAFVEGGGTLLALGDASEIGYKLELPVSSAIVDESNKPLPRARYYVPGSVLSVAVDTTSAIAWGMPPRADIFFSNNPVFKLGPDARAKGFRRVAWFDSGEPLRSGWAWGQAALEGGNEILSTPLGKGNVVLYGPEVHFRGQTHGAFRFLFNGVYSSLLTRQ